MTSRRARMLALLTTPALAASPIAFAQAPSPLDTLVDAAAQRLQIADPVAAIKWQTKGSIEDPKRVDEVLAMVTSQATVRGIDSVYVTNIFLDQINATESIEYSRFAQWKIDPAHAPTSAPDLSSSRATIDALNVQMVDELASQWGVLHSPACPAALRDATNNAAATRQLDVLYRQALDFATRSYCR